MSISNTISSYRKRRKTPLPLIIGIAAVILVVVGIIIVVIGFSGGGGGFHLYSTDTPTPTITSSPTSTNTPTETPTITPTFTETLTSTPSAPYSYVVQQGDYLIKIATDHGLTESDIVLIFYLNPYIGLGQGIDPNHPENIQVGQTIQLPPPGMPVPTATPWPTGIAPGTKITYFVLPGDSLGVIAARCNSTVDAIVAANPDILTSGATTNILPGWLLLVPVNIATPVPTAISTATPGVTNTP